MRDWGRRAAAALATGGFLVLTGAGDSGLSPRNKAFYLDEAAIAFIRPGLNLAILGAEASTDGTVTARIRLRDAAGGPLDVAGIRTPGAITLRFLISYLPEGQKQYVAYTARTVTSSITGESAVQGTFDSGGTLAETGEGEYAYTFRTRLPAGYDRNATHTVGVTAERDLELYELSNPSDDQVFHFVPAGGEVAHTAEVVLTQTCNACHNPLSAHGGSRKKVELCVTCHNPQSSDPDSLNTVDFPVMIHKIHMGEDLPSVQDGEPYRIIGFQNSVHDYSTVVFPQDVRNCASCHTQDATDGQRWLMPTRAACGACHENVNFATGDNHRGIVQNSDDNCSSCHLPQGDSEFDLSVIGAHTIPRFSQQLPGTVFELTEVVDGVAGRQPTVMFSIRDEAGNAILPSEMTSLSLVLAGPASDYTIRVSESARNAGGSGEAYSYTFNYTIPADARGTYTVGIEGYRNWTVQTRGDNSVTQRDAGENQVLHFSVDGSEAHPRREVVDQAKCNSCHNALSLHGDNRNAVAQCVLCHNPATTDVSRRPEDAAPPETVDFRTLIHKIHTGEDLNQPYTVFGFGGTPHDYTHARFPGDRTDCESCHIPRTQQLPLSDLARAVVTPRGFTDPTPPEQAACLSCHDTRAAAAHAFGYTNQIGESCAVCHGPGSEWAVDRVHAR